MKRTIILQTVAVVLASMLVLGILVLRAPKVQAKHGCSEATLEGDYLISVRGDAPHYDHDSPGNPHVLAGVRTFDGMGNSSSVYTISRGGEIIRGQDEGGTYTLGADCTGTMIQAGVRHWDMFVTRDGSEGVAIRTDDGAVVIQTLKKR